MNTMNKKRNVLLTALAIAILVPMTAYAFAYGPTGEEMGVWGYVTSGRDASLVVGENVSDERVMVEMVQSPEAAWIVVHENDNGKPGMRVGLAHIDAGISRMVEVELEGMAEGSLIVVVHADKGTLGEFDFDMDNMMGSPDRPFFVNGAELAEVVKVKGFGVVADEGQALISTETTAPAAPALVGTTLTVANATSPDGAWVVVHLNDDGMPGRRVGLQYIPAGENKNITVALDPLANLSGGVIAAIHADRGEAGIFEFDMMDKVMSPDQPYFVGGKEVAVVIDAK